MAGMFVSSWVRYSWGSMPWRRQVLVRVARIAAVLPPRGLPTKRLFLRFKTNTLHFALACVVVYSHCAIGAKHVHLSPLAEGVVDGLGHGMLGQQLLFPEKKLFQLQNKTADGKAPQPKTALLTAGISQPCIRRTLWFADTIYLCLVNRYNQQEAPRRFSERLSARSLRQNPMQLA